MGLDTSHGAWHGPYSSFHHFRRSVCKAMGGSFPPHEESGLDPDGWYFGPGYTRLTHPGLTEFLAHSDCDGEISPYMCLVVANELEALLPDIALIDEYHAACARRFIAGCRSAAAANEPLVFQ